MSYVVINIYVYHNQCIIYKMMQELSSSGEVKRKKMLRICVETLEIDSEEY